MSKRIFLPLNLNVDLVRRGYARVYGLSDHNHILAIQSNTAYARLVTKLLICEKVAEKRRIGNWERETWVETISSLPSTYLQIIKSSPIIKLMVLIFQLLRDLGVLIIFISKRGYDLSLFLISQTRVGYQKFSNGVDSINQLYFSTKNRLQQRIKR